MRKVDKLIEEYGESHQNSTNKKVHWVCVPLIFITITGFLWSIPSETLRSIFITSSPWANWATVVAACVMIYYFFLSIPLAIGMLGCMGISLYLQYQIDLHYNSNQFMINLAVFAFAWIGQFWGHSIEGKKPSFIRDIQFLLIGPAWLMHWIYRKYNIKY